MSQRNQYAKAVTNTLDSDYPDVHGSMTRPGAYNRQNHSMPPPRGSPPLQSRARSSPYAPVTMSGPNPRSNFRMAPFVTQPNVQPTHDAQPNVQPTHDTQPNVQPTHDAQPNVQPTMMHNLLYQHLRQSAVLLQILQLVPMVMILQVTLHSLLLNPTTTMNRNMLLMVVIIHQVMLLAMINSKITD